MTITLKDIENASQTLKGVAEVSPLQLSKRLSEKYKANIYLKREDLQEVRSFKIRGAYNKIASLTDAEKKKGVVCASAGNHAQGVAFSCFTMKIKGVIVMPTVTPKQKIQKVEKFGDGFIEIKLVGDTYDEASEYAKKYCKENGMVFVHAFNDPKVIAGQGTIGKEVYDQLGGKLDYIFVAIGGGGLISGIGSFLKTVDENIKVIGVESDTQASMKLSLKEGKVSTLNQIDTFADGTAVKTPGDITFEIVKKVVDDIVLGEDGEIATNMIDLYQNEGIITEPAGSLCLSGLERMKDKIKGKNVVCVICGGNNDILRYPEIMERSLIWKGLKHYFIVNFAQKPGQLKRFLEDALGPNDDIVRFEYLKKNNKESGPALVGIELAKKEDYEPLLQRMEKLGFKYELVRWDGMLYKYLV